jgi:hypothetical protein
LDLKSYEKTGKFQELPRMTELLRVKTPRNPCQDFPVQTDMIREIRRILLIEKARVVRRYPRKQNYAERLMKAPKNEATTDDELLKLDFNFI